MNGFTAQLDRVTGDPSRPDLALKKLGTFRKKHGDG